MAAIFAAKNVLYFSYADKSDGFEMKQISKTAMSAIPSIRHSGQ